MVARRSRRAAKAAVTVDNEMGGNISKRQQRRSEMATTYSMAYQRMA